MRHLTRSAAAILGSLALVGGAGGLVAASTSSASATGTSRGPAALGLSADGTVVSQFSLDTFTVTRTNLISGLAGDTKLVGIDVRPSDKAYYGVGDKGGVYTINRGNGRVHKVSQLSVALQGRDFGVDFNPAADRLRIISDTGQNLRHDVAGSATIVDGTLSYTAPTPAQGVTAAAYTNNDNVASTGTALFDLDTALNQVVQQVPANAGSLIQTGQVGRDIDAKAGFDIYSVKRNGGTTVENLGYAVLRAPGARASTLYEVDLLSGDLTRVSSAKRDIVDLAVAQR